MKSIDIMRTFDENNLPLLITATLASLELFIEEGLPEVKFKEFKRPLVVGSGNAIVTAKILYQDKDAIYADENSYEEALKKEIDGVIVFSASGGKHAPIIAQAAKDNGFETQLVTCTPNSQAEKVVGKENTIITKKNREPYTYNTSTYMGWILAKTREDPQEILDFIENEVKPFVQRDFVKFNGFLIVTPNHLSGVNQLFIVKFIELFGRKIARDVKSFEEIKHAITVVPSETELCIQFGEGEVDFVGEVLKIPIPNNAGPATLMAIGYYVIGHIQEQNPQYFKENIRNYIERNSKGSFGKALSVIVEE